MSINLVRMKFAALAAKPEVTPGVDSIAGSPLLADYIGGDCEVQFDPNVVDIPEFNGSIDRTARVVGGLRPRLRIRMPLRGSGVAGTAPEFGRLLEACTFGATPVFQWDLQHLFTHYELTDDTDIDIDLIWALEDAEDIYHASSVLVSVTFNSVSKTALVSLKSDWPGTVYPIGATTATKDNTTIADLFSASFLNLVVFSNDSVWAPTGIAPDFLYPPSGLHRPLSSSSRRRLHIVNNNAYAWQFDGLIMNGKTDDRTIERNALDAPCQRIFSQNRSMIGNEPFAVQATYNTHVAPPRFFSLANGNWQFGQAKATAEVRYELVTQPDMITIPFEYQGDEIFYDAVDTHLEFICDVAGMEIISLDANGKPATVAVRITFAAYGNGWVPVWNPFSVGSLITFEQITTVPPATIIDCVLPAWDRGEFPTLTIVPDGSGGVNVNGSPATLVTSWPTPEIPVRRRYFWEEVVFFDETFGSYVQGTVEFSPVTRTIQIVGQLPNL